MKNIFATILLAALPAWAVQFTNTNFDGITAGKPFDITWTDASGAVTLTLKNGPSDNLQTVGEITSGQTGESYTWTPSTSLASGTYALEINDGTEVNYSKQFDITGGSSASSSSSSASSTSQTSSISSTVSSTTVSSTVSSTSSSASSTSSSTVSSTTGSSTSSSATSASSTSSASHTSSAASTTSASVVPNTNAAQTMAPFVAPMLLAVGAVFM